MLTTVSKARRELFAAIASQDVKSNKTFSQFPAQSRFKPKVTEWLPRLLLLEILADDVMRLNSLEYSYHIE